MVRGWVGTRRKLGWLAAPLALAAACGGRIDAEEMVPDAASGTSSGPAKAKPGSKPKPVGTGGSATGDSELPSDDEVFSSCGNGPGPDDGVGGMPYCGGCSPDSYFVQCSRHVIAYGEFEEADAACAAANLQTSGSGGAPMEGLGGTPGQANVGGASSDDNAGVADACDTWVDPPDVEFDDGGCIGVEGADKAGSCIVGDECCVVVRPLYCGV